MAVRSDLVAGLHGVTSNQIRPPHLNSATWCDDQSKPIRHMQRTKYYDLVK